ncbi:alternate signal-mediated exported protein [Pseudarthrobacter siccitolerans]|uniref:Alternate signal-mediated exported protein n=1 Tax=Pseudarthrobacter siccitolerans TaxID=861266 RepID=A0ABU0PKC1_9MICC|nr:alternate-type signal peptide domain-containing protein [Pseudarthrobacter siccitolerans]MDQ0673701.1 alternate signal-mediated exported protein [Pseudarthrobacter siccitolerans]
MNKATKGAIAAGAAGILLAGGAGTFALWSDSQNVNAGTVSTGKLDLAVNPNGVWSEDLATIVPGDSLTYTTAVTVSATGDNLTGELVISKASFDTAFAGLGSDYVSATVAHSAVDGPDLVVDDVNTNLMTFTDKGEEHTFNVTITIEFDAETPLQEDQNLNLLLPALAVTLDQKSPAVV